MYSVDYFTMWYKTPGCFPDVWTKSTAKTTGANVCVTRLVNCNYFSMPDNPLKPGDTVMMMASIQYGLDAPTDLLFSHDPNAGQRAKIDCHGTTYGPYFTWEVIVDQ